MSDIPTTKIDAVDPYVHAYAAFNNNEVSEARSELLKDESIDKIIEDSILKNEDVWNVLKSRYEFENFNDPQTKRLEIEILKEAFDQVLALINSNKLLKEMLAYAWYGTTSGEKIDEFLNKIQSNDLKVVKRDTMDGFDNRENNNGKLYINNGKVELHLNLRGQTIGEIMHEYSAYEFIKRALEVESLGERTNSELNSLKEEFLPYVLLIIDVLSSRLSLFKSILDI